MKKGLAYWEEIEIPQEIKEEWKEYMRDENYKYQTKEPLIDIGFKERKNHPVNIFVRWYLYLTGFFNRTIRNT